MRRRAPDSSAEAACCSLTRGRRAACRARRYVRDAPGYYGLEARSDLSASADGPQGLIGAQADSDWLYRVPWGLRKMLRWVHERCARRCRALGAARRTPLGGRTLQAERYEQCERIVLT